MAGIEPPSSTPPRAAPWNDPTIRGYAFQIVVFGGVIALGWWLVANTLENMARQNIASGFGFIVQESGFDIGDTLIEYSPASSYGRAIWVGILNTLRVALIGIVLATLLGTLIGIGRLSSNWLLAKICGWYVEIIRNIPLLLQLFIWYKLITLYSPGPRQAVSIGNIFVSNRGVKFPVPVADPAHVWMGIALLVGIVLSFVVARWARARQAATGQQFHTVWASLALIFGLPLLVFVGAGFPLQWSVPELKGFNFVGGVVLLPEFFALLIGLTVYTAAFIAEIVRAGILAVNRGQSEAAAALGLRPNTAMRLVILPQALRVIIPPMTSQYLNITKNSSLAIAIGYPDIVAILNTTMNQTGQAIEGTALIMACYLTVSLSISFFMNWYNKKIALVER
ncbi:MAG: amino acid ABC transporter permease [Reyranellaceae bacterium]